MTGSAIRSYNLPPATCQMLSTVIIFIAVLSLLVFVHEFGHFVAARKLGVKVDEFGFGFPPRMIGFRFGRHRETLYSVNWIPLGGFVRLKGESGEHKGQLDSFSSQSAPRRAIILVAGVAMNFVLAWTLFSVGFAIGFPQVLEDLPSHARVTHERIQVMSVLTGSPGDGAGITTGDVVVAADGQPVTDVEAFRARTGTGEPVVLELQHAGETYRRTIVPIRLPGHESPVVGLGLAHTGNVSYPLWYAPVEGLRATATLTGQIFSGLGDLIRSVFSGGGVQVELSGPVGIAVLTGEAAKMGIRHLIQFSALLSLNLGVINVFPFPALDGGRLLFLGLERLRGKHFGRRVESLVHSIGFAVLIGLVLVVTVRDFAKFGGRIWEAIILAFG